MRMLLLLLWMTTAPIPSVDQVRELYANAASDEASCDRLLGILSPDGTCSSALLLGYKGCATMIKARYGYNPFSKFSYFKKGRVMLEKAIAADPANIELRYLRFTVQENAPGFLGYKKNIPEDRAFLLSSLKDITDGYLKRSVSTALDNSSPKK